MKQNYAFSGTEPLGNRPSRNLGCLTERQAQRIHPGRWVVDTNEVQNGLEASVVEAGRQAQCMSRKYKKIYMYCGSFWHELSCPVKNLGQWGTSVFRRIGYINFLGLP